MNGKILISISITITIVIIAFSITQIGIIGEKPGSYMEETNAVNSMLEKVKSVNKKYSLKTAMTIIFCKVLSVSYLEILDSKCVFLTVLLNIYPLKFIIQMDF